MLDLHPLHLGPNLVELLEGHLHLGLLVGAIDDFANLVCEFVQLQSKQVVEAEVLVDGELLAGHLHERRPMSVAHVRRAQIGNQRHGGEEVLDGFVQALVAIGVADLLWQRLGILLECLGLIFHLLGVDVVPEVCAPLYELHLHERREVPHILRVAKILVALSYTRSQFLDSLRELKHVG